MGQDCRTIVNQSQANHFSKSSEQMCELARTEVCVFEERRVGNEPSSHLALDSC